MAPHSGVGGWAPRPMNTAVNPSRFRDSMVKSRPSFMLYLMSTPISTMDWISSSSCLSGSRYEGMPQRSIPPAASCISKTVTACPFLLRKYAAVRPAGPAPTTATFTPVSGAHSGM